MKPFDFFRPESLEAATDLLSQHAPGVRLLAGGTDYLVELKHSGEEPGVVVDISAVPELKLIELILLLPVLSYR